MNLYVTNIPLDVKHNELKERFRKFGFVERAFLKKDEKGRFLGIAFITFPNKEEGQLALKKMDGVEINGQTISVQVSRKPYQPRDYPKDNDFPDHRDRYDRHPRDFIRDKDDDLDYDDRRDKREKRRDLDRERDIDRYRDDRDDDRDRLHDRERDYRRRDDYDRDRDRYDDRERIVPDMLPLPGAYPYPLPFMDPRVMTEIYKETMRKVGDPYRARSPLGARDRVRSPERDRKRRLDDRIDRRDDRIERLDRRPDDRMERRDDRFDRRIDDRRDDRIDRRPDDRLDRRIDERMDRRLDDRVDRRQDDRRMDKDPLPILGRDDRDRLSYPQNAPRSKYSPVNDGDSKRSYYSP